MSRFIAPFRQFFFQACDASFEFGEATALMILASIAIGRRELDYGRGIRPNLFLMLAGDSSVPRKTTCVNFAKQFVTEVDSERVGPRDYTMEGLLKWMQQKDPSTQKTKNKVSLFSEEFGADLARIEAYAATMPTDLCALYDGESFEKARAQSGVLRVDRPRVNLFAACAYPFLKRYVKPRDWMGGFYMRFLFVTPTTLRQPYPIAPPFPHPEYQQALVALKCLRDDIQVTKGTHLKLRLDPQAEQLYASAIAQFGQYAKQLGPVAATYQGRFSTTLLKLALLYQLDIDPMSWVTALAVQQAVQFAFQICWPSFQEAYKQTALGEFETLFHAVYQTLHESGPLLRSDLARRYWGNELLDKVVGYMKTHGVASAVLVNDGGVRTEKLALTDTWRQMYAQARVMAQAATTSYAGSEP